jgi:hypothetical protein
VDFWLNSMSSKDNMILLLTFGCVKGNRQRGCTWESGLCRSLLWFTLVSYYYSCVNTSGRYGMLLRERLGRLKGGKGAVIMMLR